jgi:hypothetical protein
MGITSSERKPRLPALQQRSVSWLTTGSIVLPRCGLWLRLVNAE